MNVNRLDYQLHPVSPVVASGISATVQMRGVSLSSLKGDTKMGEWINVQDLDGFFFIAGIYEIHCEPTDAYYIGQSHNIHSRVLGHIRQLRRNDHGNRAFQLDWNTFNPDSFRFRVLKEMPGSDDVARKEVELNIINERREQGITVYSHANSSDTEAPAPDPEPSVDGIPLSELMEAMVQPRNDNVKRDAATCVTCKSTGYYLEGFYICDDGEIRCESCCESRSEGLIGWLSTKQRSSRTYSATVRCWIRDGRNLKQEVAMALASYTNRFDTVPEVVYISEKDPLEITEVAGISVQQRAYTPKGHLEIPIPVSDTVLGLHADA